MAKKVKEYFDKNKVLIKAGDTVKLPDESIEKIYNCGDNDLGISATNPKYLEHHPDAVPSFYPLSNWSSQDIEKI
jgi:hypothetical protein